MPMAMNVVQAEQEDGVHHTQVYANIASPLNLNFFVFFLFLIVAYTLFII
jgi:hypothetical protein